MMPLLRFILFTDAHWIVQVKFTDFKIQNIVATADFKFPIKLEDMCTSHAQFSSYEPELYPGLIYRMVSPRVVLLVFVNGKVVLTGRKELNIVDIGFASHVIVWQLYCFRC